MFTSNFPIPSTAAAFIADDSTLRGWISGTADRAAVNGGVVDAAAVYGTMGVGLGAVVLAAVGGN